MPRGGSVSVERRIAYERLTVPQEHLGVLIEPPADALDALIGTDHTRELRGAELLDASIAELREQLRQRLELVSPVVLTGHQAEFGHPGVFAKTVAVDALAAKSGGSRVFLTVDSDVPNATQLAVPYVERGEVRRAFVPIPGCDSQFPIESQPRVSLAQWRVFFGRVAELVADDDTLLGTYADGLLDGPDETIDLLGAIEEGHAAVRRSLGLGGVLSIRASRLSQTPEFRAFVAHLMLNAGSFAERYNQAQRAYGPRHRVRNRQRPAPPLTIDGDRVELPLWVHRAGQLRRRLFVAARREGVDLFAGDERIGWESKSWLGCAANHIEVWRIERAGWRLRPRALALSAFTRLFVSDLFVHGVGGAKYDEMTEDFVGSFFKVELPPAGCVTATAYLPLPRYGVDREALAAAQHARRDLRFNPQRHLPDLPQDLLSRREELIRTSCLLRREQRPERAARRRVFDQIRTVNHALLHHDPTRAAALEQHWRLLEHRRRSDRVALDREYFFALHPRRTIEELVRRIRAALNACG